LFRDDRWREVLEISEPSVKEKALVRLYQGALAEQDWKGVAFRLINNHNQTQYSLIYGTKSPFGMRAFKEAAWFASGGTGFSFTDMSNPHQVDFLSTVDSENAVDQFKSNLFETYVGQTKDFEELEEFRDWHPVARVKDLRAALRELEDQNPPGITNVTRLDRGNRRKGSFTDCLITFGGGLSQSLF
jgi:hypothetical protein